MAEIDYDGPNMPERQWCPIGSLNLHTYGLYNGMSECIWCGPHSLGWKYPDVGRWVPTEEGYSIWTVEEALSG